MFSIINTTKAQLPRLPFESMKDKILGKNYELSVAVVGEARMRSANRKYRNKDCATDILSFPLENDLGEILINTNVAKKKAVEVAQDFPDYLGFLFIHGLLHLKGFKHSGIMKHEEKKWCEKFKISTS